jgi:hypothetical protein
MSEPIEIPDELRRAMVAHGVDPDEVAERAAELDLDAPREDEEWEPLPDYEQEALEFDEEERRDA